MQLDPHQVEAVSWRLRNPTGLLGDVPGVGKTAPDIVAASLSGEKLLIGCRAIARTNWRREVKTWWPELEDKNLMIVSHDGIAVNHELVHKAKAFKADTIILDEAHQLRSPYASRAIRWYGPKFDRKWGITEFADNVWPQSGTPMPTCCGDLWTHMHALRPDLLTVPGSPAPLHYLPFLERYTEFEHSPYGSGDEVRIKFWKNKKSTLNELRAIVNQFVLRREQGSIPLPPLNFEAVTIDCPKAKEVAKELLEIESSSAIQALNEAIAAAEKTGEKLHWVAPDSSTTELRRIIGEIKAPVVGRLIAEELDLPVYNKVIVFAYHHTVIESLLADLSEFGPCVVTGKTPQNKRQEMIDEFQNSPHRRVFLGQINACNESITLTAADQVVIVEDDWREDTIVQAVRRAWRRGQKKPVFARIFGLADSIDDGLTRVRTRLAKASSEVL